MKLVRANGVEPPAAKGPVSANETERSRDHLARSLQLAGYTALPSQEWDVLFKLLSLPKASS
jgi:hypothetical protein